MQNTSKMSEIYVDFDLPDVVSSPVKPRIHTIQDAVCTGCES